MEYQYQKGESKGNTTCMQGTKLGGEMTMDGSKTNIDGKAYNNPFEMVPTGAKLMKGMSGLFMVATAAFFLLLTHLYHSFALITLIVLNLFKLFNRFLSFT